MLLRKLNTDTHAGIATYVIIMFGLAFMLYLFGFQSMYNSFATGDNTATQDELNSGGFIETLMQPLNLLTIGAVGVTGAALLIGWFTKSTAAILTYAIPALILIGLNIFVFPLSDISNHTSSFVVSGVPIISVFLISFFNLFYILSVVEFIRGTPI